nr:metallophosphoesterase [Bacillus sp. FJAT-50079]
MLIVSDNHGDRTVLKKLHDKYINEVDAMIHCGDSELPADDPALAQFSVVGGNCDLDARFSDELSLDVKGTTVYVAHGHLLQIKSTLLNIAYRAKEVGASIACFGHSHLLGVELLDDILFLNPGSISLPRGGNDKTYALVELNNDVWHVRYLNDHHEQVIYKTFER